MGVFFLNKEQVVVMLQSFQLTAKLLVDELLAMPEVIEPEVAVAAIQAPKLPAGIAALTNPAKAPAMAPSAVVVTVPESEPTALNMVDGNQIMHASNSERVRELQSTVKRADSIEMWLQEAIDNGRHAQAQIDPTYLRHAEDEHE
jgi:hypothetical protein